MAAIPYFSHDFNAREDKNIKRLMRLHKKGDYDCPSELVAYARFFILLECLREIEPHPIDLTNKFMTEDLMEDLKLTAPELDRFIEDCVQSGLLVRDGETVLSESFNRRMERMNAFASVASALGSKGGKRSGEVRRQRAEERKQLQQAGPEPLSAPVPKTSEPLEQLTNKLTNKQTNAKTNGDLPSARGEEEESSKRVSPLTPLNLNDTKEYAWEGATYRIPYRWAFLDQPTRKRWIDEGHVDRRYISESGFITMRPPEGIGPDPLDMDELIQQSTAPRTGSKQFKPRHDIRPYPKLEANKGQDDDEMEFEEGPNQEF